MAQTKKRAKPAKRKKAAPKKTKTKQLRGSMEHMSREEHKKMGHTAEPMMAAPERGATCWPESLNLRYSKIIPGRSGARTILSRKRARAILSNNGPSTWPKGSEILSRHPAHRSMSPKSNKLIQR